jgi:hypothetical protein
MRRHIWAWLAVAGWATASCATGSGSVSSAPGVRGADAGRATLSRTDPFERQITPFDVVSATGHPHALPFIGGFDVPRPQFVDIDADGDLDLFVQERTGRLMHFENVGTAREPRWAWRSDFFQDLDIGEWSRFADVDDDGDLDLLAEERFSYIRLFLNEGSPAEPRFRLAADTLRDSDGQAIFSDRQNIPSLADVDCDGQTDLFLGRVDGTVARHEWRASRDGLPVYDLVTARFEDIEIVAALSQPGAPTLHGANSMFFADGDGDGDVDLFWGDYFEPGVLFIENYGSCDQPDLRSTPVPVPAEETILTSGYNAPYLVDEDGDGDLDLFVGVLGGAFNPNRTSSDNFHLYRTGPDGVVALATTRYLDQIDLGSESVPAFTDLDGDGDDDLVVGNRLASNVLNSGRLHVYENAGTPTRPRFVFRDTIAVRETYHLAPRFADLDADGRDELLLGTWNEDVRWYRDEADRSGVTGWVTPQWVEVLEAPLAELPRGSHSVPAPGDLDGDGDLDLLVGESSGEVNFFRNVGTPARPEFELVTESLDGIDTGRRSHPVLVDLDGDGDLDLVLGREGAGHEVYLNEGDVEMPRFEAADPLAVDLPPLAAPALTDLDGDGDLDLMSGGMSGGLMHFWNLRPLR